LRARLYSSGYRVFRPPSPPTPSATSVFFYPPPPQALCGCSLDPPPAECVPSMGQPSPLATPIVTVTPCVRFLPPPSVLTATTFPPTPTLSDWLNITYPPSFSFLSHFSRAVVFGKSLFTLPPPFLRWDPPHFPRLVFFSIGICCGVSLQHCPTRLFYGDTFFCRQA